MPIVTPGLSSLLTAEERQAYEDHGSLIVPGVFLPEEIAAAAEAEHLVRRQDLIDTRNLRCRWQPHWEHDECLRGRRLPRSAPNASNRWRRLLYLSYNADSDGDGRREQHYREFLAWLRKKYAEYGRTNVYFA
jgi:hypothetical protein